MRIKKNLSPPLPRTIKKLKDKETSRSSLLNQKDRVSISSEAFQASGILNQKGMGLLERSSIEKTNIDPHHSYIPKEGNSFQASGILNQKGMGLIERTMVRNPKKKMSLFKKVDNAISTTLFKTEDILHDTVPGQIANKALSIHENLLAFPKFVYPTIIGATAEEASLIMEGLEQMPMHDITSVDRIMVVDKMSAGNENAIGLASERLFQKDISLLRRVMANPDRGKAVLFHEVGHTSDYQTGLLHVDKLSESGSEPWGKEPFITSYAETNHWEDFAESHEEFYKDPDHLKEVCPEKFEIMKERDKPNLQDKIVDNEAFRETGKFIGESLDKLPGGRMAFNIARNLMGPLQLIRGANRLQDGENTSDGLKKMQGKLMMASGACFTVTPFSFALGAITGPVGLALSGAKSGLTSAVKKGDITPEQADLAATHALTVMGGPVTLPYYAIKKLITGVKGLIKKTDKEKPREKEAGEKPSMAVPYGIFIGSGAGAATGSMAGTWLGCQAGYAIGGPIGGVAGLLIGGIGGFSAGSYLGRKVGTGVGKLISPDKKKE